MLFGITARDQNGDRWDTKKRPHIERISYNYRPVILFTSALAGWTSMGYFPIKQHRPDIGKCPVPKFPLEDKHTTWISLGVRTDIKRCLNGVWRVYGPLLKTTGIILLLVNPGAACEPGPSTGHARWQIKEILPEMHHIMT